MTRVTVDSEFWGKLNNPQGPVELRDPAGRTLGFLYPAPSSGPSGGKVVSPFTDEELLRREQQPGGRPLEEILRDLSKR